MRKLETDRDLIFYRQIDIKSRVEDYLNQTFHNHTAIALHNWKVSGKLINYNRSGRVEIAFVKLSKHSH